MTYDLVKCNIFSNRWPAGPKILSNFPVGVNFSATRSHLLAVNINLQIKKAKKMCSWLKFKDFLLFFSSVNESAQNLSQFDHKISHSLRNKILKLSCKNAFKELFSTFYFPSKQIKFNRKITVNNETGKRFR